MHDNKLYYNTVAQNVIWKFLTGIFTSLMCLSDCLSPSLYLSVYICMLLCLCAYKYPLVCILVYMCVCARALACLKQVHTCYFVYMLRLIYMYVQPHTGILMPSISCQLISERTAMLNHTDRRQHCLFNIELHNDRSCPSEGR